MEKTRTCTDDVRRLRGAFGGVETGKGLRGVGERYRGGWLADDVVCCSVCVAGSVERGEPTRDARNRGVLLFVAEIYRPFFRSKGSRGELRLTRQAVGTPARTYLSCEIHAVRRSVVHVASIVSNERVLACQIRRTKARVVVPDAPVQHRHAFHLFAVRDLQQVVQIRVVRVRVRAFVITGHVLRIHGRTELVQPRSGVQGLQGVCRFHGLGGRHAGASANRSGCAIRRVTRDVQKPVMRRFRERPHTELSSWIVGDTGSGRV